MELLERSAPLSLAAPHPGVAILSLHGKLSRVTRSGGAVLGYIELVSDSADQQPYVAKRLRPRAQGFLEVGRFWSADDAVDALS